MMKRTNKVSGFTLVEMVVIMGILGALAGILLPMFSGYIEHANNAADLTHIHHIINAVNEAIIMGEDEGFYDNIWWDPKKPKNHPENENMGYIYVDNDEVRTSSYAISRLLENMGFISDYNNPDKKRGSSGEPCYKIGGNSRLRCMSTKLWCRYQISFNIDHEHNNINWGITCARSQYSSNSFTNRDTPDNEATEKMAARVGVTPYYRELGGLD